MAIEFGTGGLRGLLGAGEDRINEGTVSRATRGLARYLLQRDAALATARGVAVAYDTRNRSQALAKVTAGTLAAFGIPAYLFERPTPTPVLSFAVRRLGCAGGVVITASHNPKEYNGYKVYNHEGCQLVPREADAVTRAILQDAGLPPAGRSPVRPVPAAVAEAFLQAALSQSRISGTGAKAALRIVYTPLHGTGGPYVEKVLLRDGFFSVSVVPEQAIEDGNFPTVESPNPEEGSALTLAIRLAEREGADLVLGTDPDCDRVGAAVRHEGAYQLISGNQMGALLMDFLLITHSGDLPKDGTVLKTIVTNDLGAEIARGAGLSVIETLTGFKYIGEKISEFEKSGAGTFVFGYEESYGYLVGTHARDKDAVVASLLIAEMAAFHKRAGRTLVDALDVLYGRFGAYADALDTLKITDIAKTKAILQGLRAQGSGLWGGPCEMRDYAAGLFGLPPSDVLKYVLPGGAWAAVRPSGTEPKLKVYFSARGETKAAALAALTSLRRHMERAINDKAR